MRKQRLIIILIIILVVGGVAAAWFGYKQTHKPAAPSSQSKLTPAQKAKAREQIHELTLGNKIVVLIDQASFSPNTSTVEAGMAVEWQNTATIPHQVVTDDGKTITAATSPVLAPGQSFKFTFTKKGTYKYHDNLHPEVQGTVTVN